jgi:hypothetical protein
MDGILVSHKIRLARLGSKIEGEGAFEVFCESRVLVIVKRRLPVRESWSLVIDTTKLHGNK